MSETPLIDDINADDLDDAESLNPGLSEETLAQSEIDLGITALELYANLGYSAEDVTDGPPLPPRKDPPRTTRLTTSQPRGLPDKLDID